MTSPKLPATETIAPRYAELDAWPAQDILAAMWEGQLAAVAAIGPALPAIAEAAEAALPRLRAGGRLVYAGAGTSGRIGVQDGAELPPTFDWPQDRLLLLMAGGDAAFTRSIEGAEDDTKTAEKAAETLTETDIVIGIAASGATPYTTALLRAAAARGALTIAVANSQGPLLDAAEHKILAQTGPEAIAGSTRMKAGTAQKIVLNLLSSLLMVRLGRVHRGLMVDMQARNAKLRLRAIRMLRHLTGCDEAAATDALARTDGHVKTAVLLIHGIDPHAAQAILSRNAGSLRRALKELTK